MDKAIKLLLITLIVLVVIGGVIFTGTMGLLGNAIQNSLYAVNLIPLEIRFFVFLVLAFILIAIAKNIFN